MDFKGFISRSHRFSSSVIESNWTVVKSNNNTSYLTKAYNFKTFKQSMSFINNNLVPVIKNFRHHPKIILEYNKLTIELTTHDAPSNNNIGEIDYAFAQELDKEFNILNDSKIRKNTN